MAAADSDYHIQRWLGMLNSTEGKAHASAALEVERDPTYDERVIAVLKQIALEDDYADARGSAKRALEKISQAHFAAGNDIRAYLEQLRTGSLKPKRVPPAAPMPIEPVRPNAPVPTANTSDTMEAGAGKPLPKTGADSPIYTDVPVAVAPVAAPQTPPPPAIPFDQWLLSERNIKLALYSGGFLLLLAGLIFVGVNWAYLPGIAKLGVTLAVTFGMFAGGVVLYKRPTLTVGGTALLAIASGFLPLNFVVTHIYLTSARGVGLETLWFVASVVCGAVYFATALWSRQNLFTVFTVVALLSTVTAPMRIFQIDLSGASLVYAIVTIGILLAAYRVRSNRRVQFMARTLRIAAYVLAPISFLIALAAWATSFSLDASPGSSWLALVAMLVIGAFYVVDDWRMHSLPARWGAAFVFGIVAALICTQLHLASIQTGLVLKILAAVYLVLGKFLQRDRKLNAGLPLYAVSALLALFVTLQAGLVYLQTPEHLALALVGDVALLALAAFLFRRVEFVFGAAWLVLAPVYIYGNVYLHDLTQRGLAFGAVGLVYTAIGFRYSPRKLEWALPFLSVAAFLSVVVPSMFYRDYAWMTGALMVIAGCYAAMAVRMQRSWLALPAIAAVNAALLSGTLIWVSELSTLLRVLAFAFCGWGVILFFARRGMRYIRLNEWADVFRLGAVVNFGLSYALLAIVASSDFKDFGFVSQAFGLTLIWGVALLALTAYLFRRAEFVYAAAWLFIAPTYIFASLYLQNQTQAGLVLGVLLLIYTATGYFIGRGRLKWGGAFLSGAAILSVLAVVVANPNYAVMTGVLLGITLVYAFCAVWLRWSWLTLAALVALNLAVLTGVRTAFTVRVEIQQVSAIAYAVLGVALIAGGVEVKRRGWLIWRFPLYVTAIADLMIASGFAGVGSELLVVVVSAMIGLVSFAMQWVERVDLRRLNMPPVLSYLGAAALLNTVYFATRVLNLQPAFMPVTMVMTSAVLVGVALILRRGEFEKLYGEPLRYVGLLCSVGTLAAAVYYNVPEWAALTYTIAGLTFAVDGWMRKQIGLVYAGGAGFVVAFWCLMRFIHVSESQAFAIPLGVLSLAIGWSEARRGSMISFQVATAAGLFVLLGSAFYQSLSGVSYAALLFVESVAAFGLGLGMRSRIYVEAGILALVANGLAQFGPAFVNLERWIQIGTIGSVLLIGGLMALFRRQRLLEVRQAFTSEWKMWKP